MSKIYIVKSGARISGTSTNEKKTKTEIFCYVLKGEMVFNQNNLQSKDEDNFGHYYYFRNKNCGSTDYTINANDVTEIEERA